MLLKCILLKMLLIRLKNSMALSIVSDLWQRVQEYFSQPYSLQKFIEDHKPSSMADIEYLEKLWYYHTNKNSWL